MIPGWLPLAYHSTSKDIRFCSFIPKTNLATAVGWEYLWLNLSSTELN
jgi:hypothetical protein